MPVGLAWMILPVCVQSLEETYSKYARSAVMFFQTNRDCLQKKSKWKQSRKPGPLKMVANAMWQTASILGWSQIQGRTKDLKPKASMQTFTTMFVKAVLTANHCLETHPLDNILIELLLLSVRFCVELDNLTKKKY